MFLKFIIQILLVMHGSDGHMECSDIVKEISSLTRANQEHPCGDYTWMDFVTTPITLHPADS